MKKIYATVLMLILTMGLAACGEQEPAGESSVILVEGENILQTEVPEETVVTETPMETDKPQGEDAEEDLPIAEFEETADELVANTATATPDKEEVAEPTEVPTMIPDEDTTKDAEVKPTEAPTAQPTETPVEESTEKQEEEVIELPFVPIN